MARRSHFAICLLLMMLPVGAALAMDAPLPPPSEPVYEVNPGDRPGYVRVDGHWEWTGKSYMWSPGRWLAERPGYVWAADTWSEHGKKWRLNPGHWEQDPDAPEPEPVVVHESAPVVEELSEPPVEVKHAGKHAKAHKTVMRPVVKPDYSNTNQWPRVVKGQGRTGM